MADIVEAPETRASCFLPLSLCVSEDSSRSRVCHGIRAWLGSPPIIRPRSATSGEILKSLKL